MNINEHTEHFGGEEKIDQDVVSNLSDIIQYTCDIFNNNENVILENVHDVQNVYLYVKEQQLIVNEHPDIQIRCSADVHCESLSKTDEISSQSSITNAYDTILTDPFIQPKKNVPTSNRTPLICRSGCKHYDGVKNAGDGSLKEFCWYGRSHLIEGSRPCKHFEDKNPVYEDEDGILRF